LAKSAGNVFTAELAQKSAGKSARKAKSSSNGWAVYKGKLELTLGTSPG